MPYLIVLASVIGGALFWYYRLRDLGHAANDVVDVAQRARGAYRRRQFRNKAESSPIESVDDPAAAATATLIALCRSRGEMSQECERAIKAEIVETMGLAKAEELYVFSRWVADHTSDPEHLTLKFARLWIDRLSPPERLALYGMAERVVAVDGAPTLSQEQSLKRLKDRLGLTRP